MMLQRQLIWFSVKIQAIIRIEDVKDSGSCKLKGDVEEKCWPQQIKLDVSTLLFRASKFPSLAYFSFTTDHKYFINTFNEHYFCLESNSNKLARILLLEENDVDMMAYGTGLYLLLYCSLYWLCEVMPYAMVMVLRCWRLLLYRCCFFIFEYLCDTHSYSVWR